MALDKGTVGERYTVTKILLPQQVGHRLGAIGMTRGAKVRVLGKKSGALILEVRGARFALGRGIARGIEVA